MRTLFTELLLVCGALGMLENSTGDRNDGALLEVAIAVPKFRGVRPIIRTSQTSHFHVVIRNASGEALRIWSPFCLQGHDCLTFHLAEDAGHATVVRKRPTPFLQNAPEFVELSPGESCVVDVQFASGDWLGFPRPRPGVIETAKMRCVYEIRGGNAAREHDVWTGTISSKVHAYQFESRVE